jgi:hypothetical protein
LNKNAKNSNKSFSHYDLVDALRSRGCAVCRLVNQAGHRYLDNLLYELVNDPGVQKEFKGSLGLCNRHAYQLLDFGDGLGTAVLYRAATRKLLELLPAASNGSRPRASLRALLGRPPKADPVIPEPGIGCMVCRSEGEAEERYLRALLDGAEDGSLEGLLDGPGAVCIRHLSRASAVAEGRLPHSLVEVTWAALRDLDADLGECVRHSDYRFRDEPWGSERDSWRRVVQRIVGQRRA